MNVVKSPQNWRDFFPFDTPRGAQAQMCDELTNAIIEHNMSVVLAPNGFGKTITTLSVILAMGKDVIFLTRTHRQIEHIAEQIELISNKIGKDISYVVLGSKKQYCINAAVNSTDYVNTNCTNNVKRTKQKEHCTYKINNQTRYISHNSQIIRQMQRRTPKQGTIEKLKSFSEDKAICPYYLARIISSDANIIFCPYNYVFNPKIRNAVSLMLHDKIVVVDECHNIIQVMEESMKRQMSRHTIQMMLKQPLTSPILGFLRKVDQFFEHVIAKNRFDFIYHEIQNIIHEIDITAEKIEHFSHAILKMSDDPYLIRYIERLENIYSFFDTFRSIGGDAFLGNFSYDYKNRPIFIIQNLDVSSIVHDIILDGAKIVFMTGTLNPELFLLRFNRSPKDTPVLEYSSMERQINLQIIEKGIKNQRLSSMNSSRDNDAMCLDYGYTLRQMIGYVNGGSLIFFPSYAFKAQLIELWLKHKILIKKHNFLYFQYQNGMKIPIFNDVGQNSIRLLRQYRQYVGKKRQKGVLMACFRSRASEGEDFRHDLSRAIFIIGIPLANYGDKTVLNKIEYYDIIGNGKGKAWYSNDALHAVNQAIGRGIRDYRTDYCSIFLLDFRYKLIKYFQLLCRWMKNHGMMPRTYIKTINQSICDMVDFQNEMNEK